MHCAWFYKFNIILQITYTCTKYLPVIYCYMLYTILFLIIIINIAAVRVLEFWVQHVFGTYN